MNGTMETCSVHETNEVNLLWRFKEDVPVFDRRFFAVFRLDHDKGGPTLLGDSDYLSPLDDRLTQKEKWLNYINADTSAELVRWMYEDEFLWFMQGSARPCVSMYNFGFSKGYDFGRELMAAERVQENIDRAEAENV